MSKYLVTVVLLCCSNVFMTFAWYGHLKNLSNKPWIIAAIVSWGIALFEYLLQVPANRIGHHVMSIGQLKILQFFPVRGFLHEGKTLAGLSLGRPLPDGRGVLPLPQQNFLITLLF
jgi:Putative member of DMT superfamily (DUF486)